MSSLTATTGDAELYAIDTAASVDDLTGLVLDQLRSMPTVRSSSSRLVGRSLKFSARLRRLL